MSTDLESILSGQGAAAPAPEANEPIAQPETPPAEQPEGSQEAEPQTDERGMVPIAALQAERQKAKRYTEQVAEFQQKFEQQNAQWEQRFSQIIGAIQPRQAQPEPEAAPQIWDDPNAFVRSQAMEMVSPLQQQVLAMARQVAEMQFQPDTVKEAEAAFNAAAATGKIDPDVHRRINSSPNPFAAAVQWHQQQTAMAEIGSDPAAYRAKLAEEVRAQIMAEMQQGTQPAAQQRPAPVMPGNFATGRNVGARTGPQWSGPSALDDILNSRR